MREYFAQTLINNHEVPAPEAHIIASKWQYGRGEESLCFSRENYRELFGVEIGEILYRYAQVARSKPEPVKREFSISCH